jgi:ATP-dependent RNA helicase DeaD
MDRITSIIEEEDLTSMVKTIERQVNAANYTVMDIAAAFLKLHMGQQLQNS